jgi:nicotinamide riboside transporter PnuC
VEFPSFTLDHFFSFFLSELTLAHFLQGAIVVSGVIGQVLVIRKQVSGFYVWMVSNLLLMVASFSAQLHGMVFLYLFYFGMCFWGAHEWRKTQKNKN